MKLFAYRESTHTILRLVVMIYVRLQKPMSIIYLTVSYAMLSASVITLLEYTALYKFVIAVMIIMFGITYYYLCVRYGGWVDKLPAVYCLL